jgi:hypothetical protein
VLFDYQRSELMGSPRVSVDELVEGSEEAAIRPQILLKRR